MSQYRYMRQPPSIGQLRFKQWRFSILPTSERDPVWVKRCKDYWELQGETYGLKLSNFTLRVFIDEGVVETAVRVVDILPGERVRDYRAPRVRS